MSRSRVQSAIALVVLIVCTVACVRREGRNSDCTWPGEVGATRLDPTRPEDARHLSSDTEFAEELADRYTNIHFGPHSGYVGPPVAGRERHECMAKLFGEIAATHGVPTDSVIAAFGQNRWRIDFAEILFFAVLFTVIATVVARRIWKRYPPSDGWVPGVLVNFLCGLASGFAAFLTGSTLTGTIENIRIGTGHLGSRALRLPLERHANAVFVVGAITFWLIAAVIRLRLAKDERVPAS